MDRVVNRQTTWYVINIKARRNQTPQHYVDAWNLINEQDPLIELPKSTNRFASVRTMSFSGFFAKPGAFCSKVGGFWMKGTAFYKGTINLQLIIHTINSYGFL